MSCLVISRLSERAKSEQGKEAAGTEGSISHEAFSAWLLGAIAAALLVIGSVNWYVDPTGVTGRATRWRIADNAEVRSVKIDLYEALETKPEVVLLGSSRVMKFQPSVVQRLTGDRAFNAAVSGGVPLDALLLTRWLAERQPRTFPHLVWGLDIDAFRNKQLDAGLSTDPRMQRYISPHRQLAAEIAKAGALTEWGTVKATVRSMHAGARARPGRETRGSAGRPYAPDGFQQWSLPLPKRPVYLGRAVRRQIEQYAGFIFGRDGYTGVESGPLDEFREVVTIANRHGDVPTVFLTPYQPIGERVLARYGIGARTREVRARLRSLQNEVDVRFRVVDLTRLDSFGGDPAQFYDGVHMTPTNTARVLARLDRDRLLARGETRNGAA